MWGSKDSDQMFSLFSWESSLNGDSDGINEWINQWLWRKSISLHRTLLGNMEGGSFTEHFEGKVNYYGKCRRKLRKQVFLSVGVCWGTWVGWSIYWEFWELVKEGSGYGAFLSAGALLGEPGGGELLCRGSGRMWGRGLRGGASLSMGGSLGSLKGGSSTGDLCLRRALEMGLSFHRGPAGKHGGVRSTGTLRDSWSRALETECLCLWALCEGNLEGGSFTGDLEGYVDKAQVTGISLHRGAIGEPEGGLIYQGLWEMDKGGSRGRASLSEGALWGEPKGGLL